MKNKEDIKKEVEKTMNLLDEKHKIATDDFFYTRLSAKMEPQEGTFSFEWLWANPLLKPLLVAFILFINIVSISHLLNTADQELTSDELIGLFNEEYAITQSTDSYLVINEDF